MLPSPFCELRCKEEETVVMYPSAVPLGLGDLVVQPAALGYFPSSHLELLKFESWFLNSISEFERVSINGLNASSFLCFKFWFIWKARNDKDFSGSELSRH